MNGNQPNGRDPSSSTAGPADRATRALAIGFEHDDQCALLNHTPADIARAPDEETAWAWLESGDYDALLIGPEPSRDQRFRLAERLRNSDLPARVIFALAKPSATFSVDAMRCGAIDLIRLPIQTDRLASALDRAREQADAQRRTLRRFERLRKICQRLHASREDANRQVDVLCSDLARAYQEIARQMPTPSATTTYARTIRQELDVEALLRSTLEHVLAKTGPTNAAVYLPTGTGDYALGAYVSYSLPASTDDVVLDHMADTLAPAFANEADLLLFDRPGEFAASVEGASGWLGDDIGIVFSCQHDEETLAVVTLFRDPTEPFPDDAIREIESVRDDFAAQLAKVISIHNRHKPKDVWPGFEVDENSDDRDPDFETPDDYGLAA